jgi:hypothetical protein
MKKLILLLALGLHLNVYAQSDSFQAFRNKFAGEEDVHSFKVSGFIVRSVLALAGEHEAREATRGISKVRLVVAPRLAFEAQRVTVDGFRRVLREDAFEELMNFREDGDKVTVYSNSASRRRDHCYMMLVEDEENIVLIEVSGYVNEGYFRNLVKLQQQRT